MLDEVDVQRRSVLRWLVLAGVGGGLAVLGSGSLARTQPVAAAPTATLRAKVVYFQMSQQVNVPQEYFEVQSPSTVGSLMTIATQRHPSLLGMEKQMMILVDGRPANASTPLNDGDEVDLIPTFAGG